MIDLRPVAHVIGLVTVAVGLMMIFPMLADLSAGSANWGAFGIASALSVTLGAGVALATANAPRSGMSVRQVFLITTLAWIAACIAGAVPLVIGAPGLSVLDALFESTSGLTTTGATVIVGLQDLPPGVNLWRVMLHWMGGLGIVIVAMLFLPVMNVGGMQFFRSEGFDTLGKILPRALDISSALLQVYVALTAACALAYLAFGMTGIDALVHALSTVSTGGFSNTDQSFARFQGPLEYVAVIFMILGSLPFIRFIQIWHGEVVPLWRDRQVRAYLRWIFYAICAVFLYEATTNDLAPEPLLRETVFNVVSVFSGTGFTSVDLSGWGAFPFVVLFCVGLIGGCTGSTGCSVKVFRWLILIEAVKQQLRRLFRPSEVSFLHFGPQRVEREVLDAVIFFFAAFILTFGLLAVALGLCGLSLMASITAAWTAIANVGPAFGPEVHPTGALGGFPAAAKAVMILGMLLGRLELLTVYVLLLPRFWRG